MQIECPNCKVTTKFDPPAVTLDVSKGTSKVNPTKNGWKCYNCSGCGNLLAKTRFNAK